MSRPATLIFAASFVCLLATAGEARPPIDCDLPESIGSAKMLPDGTIAFQFLAYGENGMVGHGYVEVGPSDPEYEEFKVHIGGIRPGEERLVPPWLPEHCSVP